MDSVRFTLRQLEIFVAVARTGSISKAGLELHCSASAVSASVTELEKAVGTQLCVRKKSRGVVLTAQGHLMQGLAQRLLSESLEVANQMDDDAEELGGVLRVGCYGPLAAPLLPSLLHSFSISHPGVQIELTEGNEDRLIAATLAGDIEVSLMYEPSDPTDLELHHLLSRRPYVLVSADHRFADRTSVSLAEMADDPLVMLDLPPSMHYTLAWFREAGVRPNVRWRTHDLELVRSLVGHGLGYAAMLQRQRHPQSLDGNRLRALDIEPPLAPVEVYAVRRRGSPSRRVQAFLEMAVSEMSTAAPWTGITPAASDPAVPQQALMQ